MDLFNFSPILLEIRKKKIFLVRKLIFTDFLFMILIYTPVDFFFWIWYFFIFLSTTLSLLPFMIVS